jgi:hypothetical protein
MQVVPESVLIFRLAYVYIYIYISLRTCLSAAPIRQVIISLLSLLRRSRERKRERFFSPSSFLRLDRGLLYQHSSSFFLSFSDAQKRANVIDRNRKMGWQNIYLVIYPPDEPSSIKEKKKTGTKQITSLYVRRRRRKKKLTT